MSLLRRVRTELTGAVRSVRYDMGRRPVEPPSGGPDMTSTGMNTFGGFTGFDIHSQSLPVAQVRRPRRALAVTALGVLTVVGAVGAYLGVVSGLGSLLGETPAAADTFPPQPAVTSVYTPNAGIGAGPAAGRTSAPRTRAAKARPAAPTPATTDPVTMPARKVSPIRTTKPAKTAVAGAHPPVPTPTVPSPSVSLSPSGSPSPSASVSSSETSATPADSVEPGESPDSWYRRRHN
ncbi:hypothetical protein [Paractinoplanes durhamensis]|uniref:Uncharacterized protein n=1 Tax=Paractinoplanes durhamensis TaxID=113563 RepID=A0ABQ3Z3P7_9ACTN|nr:hypothetical protein [Actinoplanes durhamensis]GIE04441.1 hypothetical protein Adu01nite_57910 [Actinoplanes durhamensis]